MWRVCPCHDVNIGCHIFINGAMFRYINLSWLCSDICHYRTGSFLIFVAAMIADVLVANRHQGPDSIQRCHLTSIGNPIVEIRRSYDRLISTMGFPILVRWYLYIESGPRPSWPPCRPTLHEHTHEHLCCWQVSFPHNDLNLRWRRITLSPFSSISVHKNMNL